MWRVCKSSTIKLPGGSGGFIVGDPDRLPIFQDPPRKERSSLYCVQNSSFLFLGMWRVCKSSKIKLPGPEVQGLLSWETQTGYPFFRIHQGKKEVAFIVSKTLVSCFWACGESVNPPKLNFQDRRFRGFCRGRPRPATHFSGFWPNHIPETVIKHLKILTFIVLFFCSWIKS